MDKDTFGSVEQYRMLDFLTEKISLMEPKHKGYLSSVLEDINTVVRKAKIIRDPKFHDYVLDLVYADYSDRVTTNIKGKYDEKIFTYIMNYLNAKVKNAKRTF